MNFFRVSPGLAVFMKVSPMRKPRKPVARRRQMVSGSEMPLSETRSGDAGPWVAYRLLQNFVIWEGFVIFPLKKK